MASRFDFDYSARRARGERLLGANVSPEAEPGAPRAKQAAGEPGAEPPAAEDLVHERETVGEIVACGG